MKKALSATAVLAVGIGTGQALAEVEQMRHGLWEHSFTMKSQSGDMETSMNEMQQQLAGMPPEQRKMMEQMMASQGMSPGPSKQTIRVCISKEKAAQGLVPQQDGDCSQEVIERRGNTVKMKFTCAGNPPSSGEGEITFSSPTAYTGKSIINTTVQGKPERMTINQSGKWLSYDCGSIKAK